MKRSPLIRKTALRAKSPWRPVRRPLARESAKRRAERPLRDAVRAEVLERDGGCVLRFDREAGACHGPVHVHEVAQRSVVPGSHLRVDLCVALCAGHHSWAHRNIDAARARGLIVDSWEVG